MLKVKHILPLNWDVFQHMLKCFPEAEPRSTRVSCDTQGLCGEIYFLLETYQCCSLNVQFLACLSVGGTPKSSLAFAFGQEAWKEKKTRKWKKNILTKAIPWHVWSHVATLAFCLQWRFVLLCVWYNYYDRFFFLNSTINRIFPGLLCISNRIFTSPLGSERKESKCQKAGAFPVLKQRGCNHV